MLSSLNRQPGGSLWAVRSFSLSAPSLNKLIFKQSATGEGGVLREVREGSLSRWITLFSWSLVFSPDSRKTQVTVPGGFQNFLSLAKIDLIPSCLKSPRLLLLSVGPRLHRAARRRSPTYRPVPHPSHLPSESHWASVHLHTWTQAVLVTPVSLLSPPLLIATSFCLENSCYPSRTIANIPSFIRFPNTSLLPGCFTAPIRAFITL